MSEGCESSRRGWGIGRCVRQGPRSLVVENPKPPIVLTPHREIDAEVVVLSMAGSVQRLGKNFFRQPLVLASPHRWDRRTVKIIARL